MGNKILSHLSTKKIESNKQWIFAEKSALVTFIFLMKIYCTFLHTLSMLVTYCLHVKCTTCMVSSSVKHLKQTQIMGTERSKTHSRLSNNVKAFKNHLKENALKCVISELSNPLRG